MVQLKYFGDSRDFFKYDLITALLTFSSLRRYAFIPMLTEHRDDNEGKKVPRHEGGKSAELLEFMFCCNGKSLTHWETWLRRRVEAYVTIEPVDATFFSDQSRDEYWKAYQSVIGLGNALIFLDPDTGLETGKPGYLKKMGREKYILNYELRSLIAQTDQSSVLMLYQHLPMDKRMHISTVEKKLGQVQSVNSSVYTCAYREDDLAFLFVSKEQKVHEEVTAVLRGYHARSIHKYKSLHIDAVQLGTICQMTLPVS